MFEETINLLNKEIKKLHPREAEVIEGRFLSPKNTLEDIGKKFSLTRERVRQIQNKALKQLYSSFKQKRIEETEDFKNLLNFISNLGGIRREDLLLNDLQKLWRLPSNFKYALRFISYLIDKPKYFEEDKNFHSFYYLSDRDKQKVFSTIEDFLKFCRDKGKNILLSNEHLAEIKDTLVLNRLSISKNIGINVFGDIGPAFWPEISPKNSSDKVCLVLKKSNQPLHFKEIARLINYHFKSRKVLVSTIHNELIRDERFVLVGRGIYALAEQGFKKETVCETIKRLLEEKGPLSSQELISLIGKEKFFKKKTILFNLQNRKIFRRLNDGRYILNREI